MDEGICCESAVKIVSVGTTFSVNILMKLIKESTKILTSTTRVWPVASTKDVMASMIALLLMKDIFMNLTQLVILMRRYTITWIEMKHTGKKDMSRVQSPTPI